MGKRQLFASIGILLFCFYAGGCQNNKQISQAEQPKEVAYPSETSYPPAEVTTISRPTEAPSSQQDTNISPLPTTVDPKSNSRIYQGLSAYSSPFQITYDTTVWKMTASTTYDGSPVLQHISITDCSLALATAAEGVPGTMTNGSIEIDGNLWEVRHFWTTQRISYYHQVNQEAYLFGIFYSGSVTEDKLAQCQKDAQRVIATLETSVVIDKNIQRYIVPDIYTGANYYSIAYSREKWRVESIKFIEESGHPELVHLGIPGCRLYLRDGPRGMNKTGEMVLGDYTWSIAVLSPFGEAAIFVVYWLNVPDPGISFIIRLSLPNEASSETREACQRAAEAVLDTFFLLD